MARLSFTESTLEKVTLQPTDKFGLKSVLEFETRLTHELAKLLKCQYLFDDAGNPRDHVKKHTLDVKLADVDFIIPSPTIEAQFDEFRPEIIRAFAIDRLDDFKLMLSFTVHISGKGKWRDIGEFADAFNKRTFECAIRSLQADFDFSAENPGGTQANMSGDRDNDDSEDAGDAEASGPLFTSCAYCDSETPFTEDRTGHVVDGGEVVLCSHPADQPGRERADPLPTAQSMGAGRKKQKRGRVVELPTAEEVEDGVIVH